MKSISVRELRQNPTNMLRDVEAGETYTVTSYNRPIARIVPVQSSAQIIPPRKTGGANTSSIPRHEPRTASSVDDLLEDMKGEW